MQLVERLRLQLVDARHADLEHFGNLGEARGDNAMKSAALTRAVAALTALRMGVDGTNPTGAALLQLYDSARYAVLDCAVAFDAATLEAIGRDFHEIRLALRAGTG